MPRHRGFVLLPTLPPTRPTWRSRLSARPLRPPSLVSTFHPLNYCRVSVRLANCLWEGHFVVEARQDRLVQQGRLNQAVVDRGSGSCVITQVSRAAS